ncbi:MAG: hypothetical protein IPO81_14500 [Kouleothrix sp.]|nr:hypothetical protein [Kouleothrix sp.]
MRILGVAALVGVGGYILGVVVGIALVQLLSPNRFDQGMESVMTGFFVVGPAGAVLAFAVALLVQLLGRGKG